jgi:outer membrane immunogenic protein
MKRSLCCGVALVALAAGSALAADLPARTRAAPPPAAPPVAYAYNWSGFYIGAHGGGGWSDKCFAFGGFDDGCHKGDGWLAGGQLGFNWQTGNVVFGVEVSGSFADISGSNPAILDPTDTYHARVDSVFLATGRLGWSWDRVLAYVSAGGAWVRDRFEYVDAGFGSSTARETRWGWTVGGGLELGLAPNWSVGVQYNYVDLGDRDTSFTGAAAFNTNVDQQLHLATARLNYRFGGPPAPVVARY